MYSSDKPKTRQAQKITIFCIQLKHIGSNINQSLSPVYLLHFNG